MNCALKSRVKLGHEPSPTADEALLISYLGPSDNQLTAAQAGFFPTAIAPSRAVKAKTGKSC
jgi:hypothetical protein